MTQELKDHIDLLLALADQATDPHANGLLDREDLVRLVSNFSDVTRTLMNDQSQMECEGNEMIRRLQRSSYLGEIVEAYPTVGTQK